MRLRRPSLGKSNTLVGLPYQSTAAGTPPMKDQTYHNKTGRRHPEIDVQAAETPRQLLTTLEGELVVADVLPRIFNSGSDFTKRLQKTSEDLKFRLAVTKSEMDFLRSNLGDSHRCSVTGLQNSFGLTSVNISLENDSRLRIMGTSPNFVLPRYMIELVEISSPRRSHSLTSNLDPILEHSLSNYFPRARRHKYPPINH